MSGVDQQDLLVPASQQHGVWCVGQAHTLV